MTDHPSALVSAPQNVIAACKGEQEHFEDWAKSRRCDMNKHPLHYIFLDPKTDAARMGWNAALAYVRNAADPAAPQAAGVGEDEWSELERLADAATQGPWKACGTIYEHMNCEVRGGAKGEGQAIAQVWDGPNAFKDGQFIAAADPATIKRLIAALRAPSREPEGGAVDDGAFKIATDLHKAYEQLIYGLPKYLDAENLTDEENMIREAWVTLDVTAHRLSALATREEASAELLSDTQQLEVPTGAGATKAACVAWHEARGENPFNVLYQGAWCGSFPHQTGPERWTFTVAAMEKAITAYLRAQPPAGEDAQPVSCQSCGGEVQGWVCQGCGLAFCERDGHLVAEHPAPDALRAALADLVSWFTKPVQGQNGMVWVIRAGEQGADDAVNAALAALQAEQGVK